MPQQVDLIFKNISLSLFKRFLYSKSTYLYRHSELTGDIARTVVEIPGLEFGCTPAEAYAAGVLHDIGKCYVSDVIIDKSSKLDEREWETMERHPVWGYEILIGTAFESYAEIILDHHEKPDGSGYPHGKKVIDARSKVIALADQIAAFLDDRPYRRRVTLTSVVNREIGKITRSLFDGAQAMMIEATMIRFAAEWIKRSADDPYRERVPAFPLEFLEQLAVVFGKIQTT